MPTWYWFACSVLMLAMMFLLGLFDWAAPSNFRWYRRLLKGMWYEVTPRPYPYIHIWVRHPIPIEHVDCVETY